MTIMAFFLLDTVSPNRLIGSLAFTRADNIAPRLIDLGRNQSGTDRADMLVGNHAFTVDEKGLRNAPDAVIDRDRSRSVETRGIGEIELANKSECVFTAILNRNADKHDVLILKPLPCRFQFGRLGAAGRTPRRPEGYKHHLAAEIGETKPGAIEKCQLKGRRRLADQARVDIARLAVKAVRQQRQQRANGHQRNCQPAPDHVRPRSPPVAETARWRSWFPEPQRRRQSRSR